MLKHSVCTRLYSWNLTGKHASHAYTTISKYSTTASFKVYNFIKTLGQYVHACIIFYLCHINHQSYPNCPAFCPIHLVLSVTIPTLAVSFVVLTAVSMFQIVVTPDICKELFHVFLLYAWKFYYWSQIGSEACSTNHINPKWMAVAWC